MTKYTLEDLKVGAVFKAWDISRTILMVGKTAVFYSFAHNGVYGEYAATIDHCLDEQFGKLVRPNVKTKKIAQLEAEIKKEGA